MSQTTASPMLGNTPLDPNAPLLAVDNLNVEFRTTDGIVRAVNGLSYSLDAGETVAILGESGSGKSVSAQAVMGIIDTPPGFITAGTVKFRGVDLLKQSEEVRRVMRGPRIAMIFQDALTALNPVFTVGWQIGELFRQHNGTSKTQARAAAIELLDRVKIPEARTRVDQYPHEFSGGMRQRAMIAMAMALDPEIIIADEPTTALDVTVQAQIMDLLKELQEDTGMGMVLITHDLAVVAEVADRVVVMYAGREVETSEIDTIYHQPKHPYTEGLLRSIPRVDIRQGVLNPIQGSPPDLLNLPSGCAFNPRCNYVRDRCHTEVPPLIDVGPGHKSACFYTEEVGS